MAGTRLHTANIRPGGAGWVKIGLQSSRDRVGPADQVDIE